MLSLPRSSSIPLSSHHLLLPLHLQSGHLPCQLLDLSIGSLHLLLVLLVLVPKCRIAPRLTSFFLPSFHLNHRFLQPSVQLQPLMLPLSHFLFVLLIELSYFILRHPNTRLQMLLSCLQLVLTLKHLPVFVLQLLVLPLDHLELISLGLVFLPQIFSFLLGRLSLLLVNVSLFMCHSVLLLQSLILCLLSHNVRFPLLFQLNVVPLQCL